MGCIEKNNKEFKALEEKFGSSDIAENIIRLMNPVGTLEFKIPEKSEVNKFLKVNSINAKNNLLEALSIDPYLNEEGIKTYLQGVIHRFKDGYYVTGAKWGSKVEMNFAEQTILKNNLDALKSLQREYPGLLELNQSKRNSKVYRVELKPNEPTPEEAIRRRRRFPEDMNKESVRDWMIDRGYINKNDEVVNEVALDAFGKREIKDKGLERLHWGDPFSIDNNNKVLFNDKYFDDISMGIENVPKPYEGVYTQREIESMRDSDIASRDARRLDQSEMFLDDSSLSEMIRREQEGDFEDPNDVNYSMQTFDDIARNEQLPDEPDNYRDWYDIRKDLLDQFIDTRTSLLRRNAEKKELESIKDSIKLVEDELKSFDPNDIKNVLSHVFNEIDALQSIVQRHIEGDVNSAMDLENNKVRDRINKLSDSFAYIKVEDNTDEISPMTLAFNRGVEQKDIDKIRNEIEYTKNKYYANLDKILMNTMKNTDHIIELSKSMEPEDYNKFIDRIQEMLAQKKSENYEEDPKNWPRRNLYGAKSYGDPLSAMLSTERDVAMNVEAGITGDLKFKLNEAWRDLRNKKGQDGKLISDRLFQKNEFGQRVSSLINMYSKEHYKNIGKNGLKRFRSDFFLGGNRSESYEHWMDFEKENFDYINLSKIRSFTEKYKDVEDFNSMFIHSNEDMSTYEREMRKKMGDTNFEIEMDKQIDGARNFLQDTFDGPSEKYHRNPLRFVNNFYSDNYNKFDKTTSAFLLPIKDYIGQIPSLNKIDTHYNKNFRQLETESGKDFNPFYTNALKLLTYTKDTMDSEAALEGKPFNYNFNDILQVMKRYKTEVAKNMGSFGSIYSGTAEAIKGYGDRFASASYQNRIIEEMKDMKLNTHMGSTGESLDSRVNQAFLGKTHSELIRLAKEKGLIIPDKYLKEDSYSKNKIAEALVREVFNKNLTLDPREGILKGASLAESVNGRRKVWGLAHLIEDFNKSNNRNDQTNFMLTWNQQQLSEEGFLKGGLGALERTKVGKKRLDKFDKVMKKLIRERQHENEKDPDTFDYDFSYEGFHYRKENGKYIIENKETKEREIIENKDVESRIQDKYNKYTDAIIADLGKQKTVGSIIGGIVNNFRSANLSLNPSSGITNREAGYVQNNQMGASGLHGYSMDDLYKARRFLAGARLENTLEYVPSIASAFGLENKKRVKQWKALKNMVEKLQLQENIIDDLDMGDGRVLKKGAWKEFLSDFAVNNAEFHNQMELLVAMLMNEKLEVADENTGMPKLDENGDVVTKPFFNAKTMELPFNPDTMKLTKEFSTDNNRSNWENYRKDKNGRSRHTNLVMRYNVVRHKGHGNYSLGDSMGIESSVIGKSSIAFQKWFFENYKNEWGKSNIDYSTGEVDVKGRKRHIQDHPMTAITLLLGQNVFGSSSFMSKMAAIGAGIFGVSMVANPWVITAMVASSIGGFMLANGKDTFSGKHLHKISKNILQRLHLHRKEEWKHQKEEARLAASFALETSMRILKSSAMVVTFGTVGKQFKSSTLKKWSFTETTDKDGNQKLPHEYTNLTLKQRKIISESAQQVADKYSMVIKYGLLTYITKAALLSIYGIAGEDDDDKKQEGLEEINKHINFLLNKEKQISSEMETFTDPTMMVNMYNTRIFYQWMSREFKDISAIGKWSDNKITGEEAFASAGKAITQFGGVPRPISGAMFGELPTPFSSDRVYTGKNSLSPYEENILRMGNPEEFLIRDVKSTRSNFHTMVRDQLVRNIDKDIRKRGGSPKLYSEAYKKKIAAKYIREVVYPAEGLNFKKGNSNGVDFNKLNNADWKAMRNKYYDVVVKYH